MNIKILTNKTDIKKQVFSPKPLPRDGLILRVQHSIETNLKSQKIRFIHASFDQISHILAAADHVGNIFLVDFVQNKFWVLPSISSCTVLKFSSYNNVEILVGISGGKVCMLNSETGEMTGELISHTESVTNVSFSHDQMCLTSSQSEAIVWDLRSNSKLQILTIGAQYELKHVLFMPVTGNLLACFKDDTMLIWKHQTFEMFKQIQPASWNTRPLKSIAFTRNGRAMVFSGHTPYLTVFMLDTWSVDNLIVLPDCIVSVKKIHFVPQLFDGGCNRLLAILTGSGVLYFYDMEQNVIISNIITEDEVTKFDCSDDGKHIACILKSGDINIYKTSQYVPSRSNIDVQKEKAKRNSSTGASISRRSASLLSSIQKQIKEVLGIDKLRAILKEFGQYPESYRLKIWTQLLDLPNNSQQYNIYINHLSQTSFENLDQGYPLENKIAKKNLRKLLCNLVTWCPFFAQVTYLPVFVFPFVKVFQNEPVLCFEAVSTIVVNWCQHWFEYFPLPPVNVLAMIENVLVEHDPDLLRHLATVNVTSKLYAWPLLEAAFSEVLATTDWCRLWDHVLTNEPAFLLTSVAAYNILHRQALFTMKSQSEFELFYHNQNVIDVKRLISKSYTLLNSTRDTNHPRQYLSAFKKLQSGSYTRFLGFPKVLIDFELNEMDNLKMEQKLLERDEKILLRDRRSEQEEMETEQRRQEEENRLKELEKVCRQRIQEERERVKEQRKRLVDLRNKLYQEEVDMLNKSRQTIIDKNIKERKRALEKILSEVEESHVAEELEVMKVESDLGKHYSTLLHHKSHLEEALNANQPVLEPTFDHRLLKQQQQKLMVELEKVQKQSNSNLQLKHLNIASGIAAMDNLIMRIEMELAHQSAEHYGHIVKRQSNVKVLKLEAETKELEFEVSNLLSQLAEMKSRETKQKLSELQDSVAQRKKFCPQDSHYRRQQQSQEFRDNVSTISSYGSEFKQLRKLIKDTRDGYATKPSTSFNGREESLRSEEIAALSLTSS